MIQCRGASSNSCIATLISRHTDYVNLLRIRWGKPELHKILLPDGLEEIRDPLPRTVHRLRTRGGMLSMLENVRNKESLVYEGASIVKADVPMIASPPQSCGLSELTCGLLLRTSENLGSVFA